MANSDELEDKLQRWIEAGMIDAEAARRIRAFEQSAEEVSERRHGLRWPVLLAVAFGAVMIAAGVLLFVAAHWDELSPTQRFALVLAMVAGFHLAAGLAMPRMRSLGIALHGIGTASLGAGIFLAGQIFNLQEHWPSGILLWAIGALLGWVVLRDWVQATLAMVLAPAWVASEWGLRAEHFNSSGKYLVEFLAVLAFAYLGACGAGRDSNFRRALSWIGGLLVVPAVAILAIVGFDWHWAESMPTSIRLTGMLVAYALPLAVSCLLRGRAALWIAGFAAWVAALGQLNARDFAQNLALYALLALGSIAVVFWGLREQRRERIDLGVAGFAITIVAFYFSTMMDKLGRSASLVGFGLLFLLGGWKLEQFRRRLVTGISLRRQEGRA